MTFLGTENDFSKLKGMYDNFLDSILMSSYNEGFKDGLNKSSSDFNELYTQAESAIKQNLPIENLNIENPFINIVKLFIKLNSKQEQVTT